MQLNLFKSQEDTTEDIDKVTFSDPNFSSNKNLPIHRWVPWIAGFSSDFVKSVLSEYLPEKGVILDPFAGVGTTLVEALCMGHEAVGFEINPYAALACKVKTSAQRIKKEDLRKEVERLATFYEKVVNTDYVPKSSYPEGFKTRHDFYSPKVLKKVLIFQDFLSSVERENIIDIFRIAFAATMIKYSNYSYEPSLGTRKAAGKEDIEDFPVVEAIIGKLHEILADIAWLQSNIEDCSAKSRVISDSFFNFEDYLSQNSIDISITSPPYLNNYHYIRNTRPHLYWLGFTEKPKDTKSLELNNFGKYWQTVRDKDKVDLDFPNPPSELRDSLDYLRSLNAEKGIYGGNGWANYAATYFNDCYKLVIGLKKVLKSGGSAFIVVGNSIIQGLMIPTDEYLGLIAEGVGMEFVESHIPRQKRVGNSIIKSDVRVAKAKKKHRLYEAVVEIRKK